MAEEQAQAAVLFADVSGSTKLYETAGDQVAKAAILKNGYNFIPSFCILSSIFSFFSPKYESSKYGFTDPSDIPAKKSNGETEVAPYK